MGSWSAHAMASDTAMDWAGEWSFDSKTDKCLSESEWIPKVTLARAKKGLRDKEPGISRAAAYVIARSKKLKSLVPEAIKKMTAVLISEDFLSGWRQPEEAIRFQLDQLKELRLGRPIAIYEVSARYTQTFRIEAFDKEDLEDRVIGKFADADGLKMTSNKVKKLH